MTTITQNRRLPEPAPRPERGEVLALLDQLVACSHDEKRYLLENLLHSLYGDNPEGEWTVYDAPGKAYLYLLSPQARARLFVTPERLAIWEAQDPSKSRPLSEINALLARGDEDEIKAYLDSLNS